MKPSGTWYAFVTIEWPNTVEVKRWRGRSRAVLRVARKHYLEQGALQVQVGRQFWIADR